MTAARIFNADFSFSFSLHLAVSERALSDFVQSCELVCCAEVKMAHHRLIYSGGLSLWREIFASFGNVATSTPSKRYPSPEPEIGELRSSRSEVSRKKSARSPAI